MRRVTRTYRAFCIDQAARSKAQEARVCAALEEASKLLQLSPTSTELQLEVNSLRSSLADFEARKLEG